VLPSTIDPSTRDGTTGFRLGGSTTPDFASRSVASVGDVNGDGFDGPDPKRRSPAGRAVPLA